MSESFDNFMTMIKDFDRLTSKTISCCQNILDYSLEIENTVATKINNYYNKKTDVLMNNGSLTWKSNLQNTGTSILLSTACIFTVGAVGYLIKYTKEKKAIKTISKTGKQYKSRYNEFFLDLNEILSRQLNNRLKIIQQDSPKIRNLILSNNKKDIKDGLIILYNHINSYYKIDYRQQLGKRLETFFENYELYVNDLESFSSWIKKDIVLDEETFYSRTFSSIKLVYFNYSPQDKKNRKFYDQIIDKMKYTKPKLKISENDFIL